MTQRHVQQSAKRSMLALGAMLQGHLDEFRDAVADFDGDRAEHSLSMIDLALGDISTRLPMLTPAKDDFAFEAGSPSGDGQASADVPLVGESRPLTGLPVEVLGYSRRAPEAVEEPVLSAS